MLARFSQSHASQIMSKWKCAKTQFSPLQKIYFWVLCKQMIIMCSVRCWPWRETAWWCLKIGRQKKNWVIFTSPLHDSVPTSSTIGISFGVSNEFLPSIMPASIGVTKGGTCPGRKILGVGKFGEENLPKTAPEIKIFVEYAQKFGVAPGSIYPSYAPAC